MLLCLLALLVVESLTISQVVSGFVVVSAAAVVVVVVVVLSCLVLLRFLFCFRILVNRMSIIDMPNILYNHKNIAFIASMESIA